MENKMINWRQVVVAALVLVTWVGGAAWAIDPLPALPDGGLLFSGLQQNGQWDIFCRLDVEGDEILINLTQSAQIEGNPSY